MNIPADKRIDQQKQGSGHEKGIIGGASHFVGGDHGHMRSEGTQAGGTGIRHLGGIARQHEGDERITHGTAKSKHKRGEQRLFRLRQDKKPHQIHTGEAECQTAGQKPLQAGSQPCRKQQHNGGKNQDGQHKSGAQPAEACAPDCLAHKGSQQENGGKSIHNCRNGSHDPYQKS